MFECTFRRHRSSQESSALWRFESTALRRTPSPHHTVGGLQNSSAAAVEQLIIELVASGLGADC